MKKLKLLMCPKTNRSRYVSKFSILPYTQNRKHGNLGNISKCLFLQILTIVITQDLNYVLKIVVITQDLKIWTDQETERFQYDLKEKIKISEISKFRFCPVPRIENPEISEILFTSNFDTGCSSRYKNVKEINWLKN